MRQALLVSVAALALAAGSTLALSQGGGQGGGGAGPSSAPQANPSGPSGGAGGATESAPGARKGANETKPTQKQEQKSTQERTSPTQKQDQKSTQQEGSQPGTQQRQTETQPGTKQGAGSTKGTAKGGSMSTSNVSLTTEQKTTIRNTVLTSGPKVTNVNFGITVGTVVPRTVRIVPVPATLIEIQPAWRGYMYFVYADEIIIVEPRTLKIVAVLEV